MSVGISSLLQGALSQGQPTAGQRPATRTPMFFTSRLRGSILQFQRRGRSLVSRIVSSSQSESSIPVGKPLPGNVDGTDLSGVLAVRDEANNFYGSAQFMPVIAMAVNPASITFTQPKRWTKKDTRQGSVYFHFTNTQGQNNDVLTIGFKGNTGNIDLRGTVGNPDLSIDENAQGFDTGALQKFLCFHNLYALTREPMLLVDGNENIFTIGYQSGVFPEIIFNGFFSKVLEFEENGEKPNSRDYSFEFVVKETFPPLDQVLSQIMTLAASPDGPVLVPPPTGTQVLNARPRSFGQPSGAIIEGVPAPTTELPSGFADDLSV